MIGFRVLFPSLTRGGVSYEWPGGYFQQFAEEYLPDYAWNIERWIEDCAASNIGQISEECKEALDDPQVAELMKLLYKMLDKDTFRRVSVQQAINELGPEWQARCLQEQKIKKETEAQQKALEEANRREEATRTEQVKKELQLVCMPPRSLPSVCASEPPPAPLPPGTWARSSACFNFCLLTPEH